MSKDLSDLVSKIQAARLSDLALTGTSITGFDISKRPAQLPDCHVTREEIIMRKAIALCWLWREIEVEISRLPEKELEVLRKIYPHGIYSKLPE